MERGFISTPLGTLEIRLEDDVLTSVRFVPSMGKSSSTSKMRRVVEEIEQYFQNSKKRFTIPIPSSGTPFQRKVWAVLSRVEPGKTVTYAELAALAGHPKAARAVGSAMRKNPIPIVIPCHRVVPSSGGIGQYACGPKRKAWLLAHEAS